MTKQEQAMRLYKAVEKLTLQAGEDTDEAIDWLCGEHGGMFKLYEAYFSPKPAQQEPVEYVRKMIDALYENGDPVSVEAAELLERMTRQQQEPAAWVETREDGSIYYGVETDTVISDDPSWLERPMPVYTSPPASKPWVGLTDEEKAELDAEYGDDTLAHLDAIEAKLKEKNT